MLNPFETIREAERETVRWSRMLFRKSMVVELEPILGHEGVSKFEHWFIVKSVRKLGLVRKSRLLVDSSLLTLNYATNTTLVDLYSNSMEMWLNYRANREESRREGVVNNLLRRLGEAEMTILECPEKIEKIRKINEAIGFFADNSIKPAVEEVFGGAGALTGMTLMIMGLTSGTIGYVVGKTVRVSGEALISKLSGGKG